MEAWLEVWWFAYIILPVLIFLARIVDVSLGTIRILFVARGVQTLAALLGFFEVFIWLVVISSIMNNLSSPFYYIFYAAGFAAGNYVGIAIERHLYVGKVALQVITRSKADELLDYFREQRLGITAVDAEGATGPVKILYSIINRRDLKSIIEKVKEFNPKAFYSIEDVKTVSEGTFPQSSRRRSAKRGQPLKFFPLRKGK
ncbi:MAG: DUF2179 domain-containing protein [Candidatus Marinimicrobia bacterium]|jgi:uncharacterized protein YebE (UPF0316 family)|nr:DUF2179 domain-containing protein [Candidatus Neomarinimicrobiota bacterium]MBT4362671.1 DUF2179 domain-containing protein [Candidatus Neomarinimicrobiota bacterium]MBT4713319.1 DUF2179 domain-containing protein [Candidatus Neomarinimicrobiota bacterium]MBT4944840.1 DUF2179 domain-containing protein [Candidatus Neomarinimicrobiota bacterium]MBT5271676.1 DUF2179 domain-containing protein [Candidatus Neomarinimicrobiota bacterium]